MTEPTITCPHCNMEIKLTESLAAPIVASIRKDYEQRLNQKDAEVATRESKLREREMALLKEKESIEDIVADKVKQERAKISLEEAKKAKAVLVMELEEKERQLAALGEVLQQRDAKLAEAQKTQAHLLQKERELDDARRELALSVEKQVREGLEAVRDKARREAEDALGLRVREKEETIAAMQRQIEELKRKAEQGSQQLQGEVQEMELEEILKIKFPSDAIDPVPKGEFGGDVLQTVRNALGQNCGVILWESKRTKNWSDGWLPKLRDDQRAAKADVAVMVSQALPKTVETFDQIDDVWVTHFRAVLPVAMLLRHALVEVTLARQAGVGRQTKMELVYQYLTGSVFRQRVEAIVEAFTTMRADLDKEKKAITKQWAKREMQIERVVQATAGMYGDLQGIAGKSLQEVEGLSFEALENEPDAPPQLTVGQGEDTEDS